MKQTYYIGIAFIAATLLHFLYGGDFTPGVYIALVLAVVFLGVEPVKKIKTSKK
jgi:hypothetical protein